jgi:tetratricopeptide (TPR) repeat protein
MSQFFRDLICFCVSDTDQDNPASQSGGAPSPLDSSVAPSAASTSGASANPAVELFNQGCALQEAGNYSQAIAYYKQAVYLEPSFLSAHYNLANALQHTKQIHEAANHYVISLRLDPKNYKAMYNMGYLYLNDLRRPEDAVQMFEKCLSLNPSDHDARVSFALAKLELGHIEEAIFCYESILKDKPTDIVARFNLANACLDQTQYAIAVAHYLVSL